MHVTGTYAATAVVVQLTVVVLLHLLPANATPPERRRKTDERVATGYVRPWYRGLCFVNAAVIEFAFWGAFGICSVTDCSVDNKFPPQFIITLKLLSFIVHYKFTNLRLLCTCVHVSCGYDIRFNKIN